MKRRDFLKSSLLLPFLLDVDSTSRKVEQGIANLKRFNHVKLLSLEEGFDFWTDNNVEEDAIRINPGNPHNAHKRFSKDKIKDFMVRTSRTNYCNYVFHVYDKWNRIRSIFACEKTVPSTSYYFTYYPFPDIPDHKSKLILNDLSLDYKVIKETDSFDFPDLSDIFQNVLHIGDNFAENFQF